MSNLTDWTFPNINESSIDDYQDLQNEESNICIQPTVHEMVLYSNMCFWLEGVIQIIIGIFGFFGNCMAIPILLSKTMSSIFHRLLVCLAVTDNIFIVCNISEGIRNNFQNALLSRLRICVFFISVSQHDIVDKYLYNCGIGDGEIQGRLETHRIL